MANDEVVKRLSTLSAAAIRTGRPGLWNDDTLLDVAHHFEEAGDDVRRLATLELLLRSPELSEMLDYSDIYAMLYESLRHRGDFAASLRWLHAALAYVAQHDPEPDLSSTERDLAETYLQAGDFDTGLALFTRLLHRHPRDPWIHNVLALTLPDEGLASLALEVLARGRSLVAVDDSAGLRAQFAELEEEATVAAAEESSRLSEIDPTVLQAFRAALQADAAAGDAPYLPPLDQLVSASANQLPALTAAILQEGKILAPELIRMASDPTLADTPALERALALLRQLQETDAVALDELAPWLAQADGHWLQTLHSPHIGKIGGITTAALEALVADTNYATYLRENAATALIERMSPEPNRNQRLLDLLRRLLTRAEASELAEEERFVTQLIDVIVDHKMVELYPEIEAAFREDRVSPQFATLADVQEDLGLPVTAEEPRQREDGFNLLLACTVCGRERYHFVQQVTVDTGTQQRKDAGETVKYDPHIMDHEIVCPKCGARDQYRLSPLSAFELLLPEERAGLLDRLFSGKKGNGPKLTPNPRVHRFTSVIMGRPMHPLEGIDRYRQRIAANPKDADNYVRMGNILRMIYRYPQALEAFHQSYTLAPTDLDCLLTYAMAEHDFGDRAHAQALYEEAIALVRNTVPPDPDSIEALAIANEGLSALRRNRPSPWQPGGVEVEPTTASAPARASSTPKRQKLQKTKATKPQRKQKKKRKRNK
ncbi:MAG TPA: DUF1186 domain-containing protein [Caldilineaceae bacterium]|nr:DUF1186 domain-containing protein [Caldilineaceae bacterium]